MKSIKIKVQPLDPKRFEERSLAMTEELTWLWNEVRVITLRNHAFQWYEWAEKRAKDIFGEFDLQGCIRVALNFDRNSAWIGASCPIATGGKIWVDNYRLPPIIYKNKSGDTKKKPAASLKDGDKPYRPIRPREHKYLTINGKKLDRISKLDSKTLLRKLRADVGLGPITTNSDLIGGLLGQFEESWKAFLNVKQVFGKKPRYRNVNNLVTTFYNSQKGPILKNGIFTVIDKLQLKPIDKNWQQRLFSTRETIMRSYQIVNEPSGLYLCISLASPEEAMKPTLKRTVGRIKKEFGEDSTAYKQAKETADDLFKSLMPVEICEPKLEATIETYSSEALLKLDGGQLFQHNESRIRLEKHINSLKSQLGKMRQANDRKLGVDWYKRTATKNEARLSQRIKRLYERSRNSGNHFNHKLSTRLARTYDGIAWIENSPSTENGAARLDALANLRTNLERKIIKKGGKFKVVTTPTSKSES